MNKASIKKFTLIFLAVILTASIVNKVKKSGWDLPILYQEDPILLGSYTIGRIELSDQFSRKFEINPALGQNIQVRLMEGGVDGEILVNQGTPEERVIPVRFSANPMAEKVKIGCVVQSLRFRIPDLSQCQIAAQRQLAYVIHLTHEPKSDWYFQAGNSPLGK